MHNIDIVICVGVSIGVWIYERKIRSKKNLFISRRPNDSYINAL